MATSCGFESHRPHQRPIENRVRIGNHLHAPSRTNHHRIRLTFDALAAAKPGAPLGPLLHDAVAVVGAGGWGDGIGWALAMPSPLHGQLTNFLILFHYCDG
jgi:hypothetical protein